MSWEGSQRNTCAIHISKSGDMSKKEICLSMLRADSIPRPLLLSSGVVLPPGALRALPHCLLPFQALRHRTTPDITPESGCLCLSPEAKRQYSTAFEPNAAEGCQEKCETGANLGSKPTHRFLLNLATKPYHLKASVHTLFIPKTP